jgi:hypothetical protein
MIGMSVLYVECIKDLLSFTLTLRPDTIKVLEKTILNIPFDEIVIDFSGVRSMSFEFAKEYLSFKKKSNKAITEVNLPLDLRPMIDKALESV